MTDTAHTYGAWEDRNGTSPSNQMIIDASQLAAHWRRCSLTSDFWARYNTMFVPAAVSRPWLNRDAVEGILSYLLNELFENCAKFSSSPVKTVSYKMWLEPEAMTFEMTNYIDPQAEEPFVSLIHELLEGDPDELYFQKLEQNAETGGGGSGLGYLTLIKDYGVKFGFRFRPTGPGTIAVDVQAHVCVKEDARP